MHDRALNAFFKFIFSHAILQKTRALQGVRKSFLTQQLQPENYFTSFR
jgi:hypothetical protein